MKILRNLNKKIFAIFTLAGFLVYSFFYSIPLNSNIVADTSSDTWNQINKLQSQIDDLLRNIQDEKKKINSFDGSIGATQQKIDLENKLILEKQQIIDTNQQKIDLLNASIKDLNTQIADINNKINALYAIFSNRAKASYEDSYVNPFYVALGKQTVSDTFASLEYYATTRQSDAKVMQDYNNNKTILDVKLDDLDKQQTDLTKSQNDLLKQQNDLKTEKANLAAQVANMNYQKQQLTNKVNQDQQKYNAIREQINALQISTFTGGSCVRGNYWYYNQQCYGNLPGLYGSYIDMQYGCLITDIAMVATKELGPGWTPPRIASMVWFQDSYMMSWPELPGIGPSMLGYKNMGAINSQLAQGYPVIVYLSAPSGQHWVVFEKQMGDDYLIQDPWYGSDLMFNGTGNGTHQYYSVGEIGNSFVLR